MLTDELGAGQFTEAFRAIDVALDRQVVVKRLKPQYADDTALRTAFAERAREAAALVHTGIATTFACGEEQNLPFVTSYYYQNGALADNLPPPPARFPVARLYGWLESAAKALRYAHNQNVTHGDICPHNLFVDEEDELALADFSLRRAWWDRFGFDTLDLTSDRNDYLAPEVLASGTITADADRFSLALVFYHLFTGSMPFAGDTMRARIDSLKQAKPPEISRLRDGVDAAVCQAITQLLSSDPAKRPSLDAVIAAAEHAGLKDPGTDRTDAYIRAKARTPHNKARASTTAKIKPVIVPPTDTEPEEPAATRSATPLLITIGTVLGILLLLWILGVFS